MTEIDPRSFFAAFLGKEAELNIPSVVEKLVQGAVLGTAGSAAMHTAYIAGRERTGEEIDSEQKRKEMMSAMFRGGLVGTAVLGGGDIAWQLTRKWLEQRKALRDAGI